MDEERLSAEQERELLNLFEQAALNDFPNPQRIGCPGSEFLRKMATSRQSISVRDPRLRHVARCSPCFREFTAFRAQAHASRKHTRITLIAAGGVVVAMAMAGLLERARLMPLFGNGARTPAGAYIPATLDMENRSIVRGAEGTHQAPPPRIRYAFLTIE